MSARATVAGTAALAATAYWTTMSSQSQLLGAFPRNGARGEGHRIALTFDDGPNEPYTGRLERLLGERGVRATFFQVGRAVARQPEASQSLLASGHVLGNHSYSHEFHRCFTARSVDEEIRRAQAVFEDHLALRPRLYRPPWLVRTPGTFHVLNKHGMQPVSGTFCHPLEVSQIHGSRIARRAVRRAQLGGMIIFHDGYNGRGAARTETLDAVAKTIDSLGARGWTFVTVDELLGVPAYHPDHHAASCGSQS